DAGRSPSGQLGFLASARARVRACGLRGNPFHSRPFAFQLRATFRDNHGSGLSARIVLDKVKIILGKDPVR
ncbi:MAG: hypothetical protein ABIP41_05290, partial [Croceibacterium sp.]